MSHLLAARALAGAAGEKPFTTGKSVIFLLQQGGIASGVVGGILMAAAL